MAKSEKDQIGETKRLMGALVRMKPKPHEEMKVGGAKKEVVKRSQGRKKKR